MNVIASEVEKILSEKEIHLSSDWLLDCLNYLQLNGPWSSNPTALSAYVYQAFLSSDLKYSLPSSSSSSSQETSLSKLTCLPRPSHLQKITKGIVFVNKPVILQIVSLVNISSAQQQQIKVIEKEKENILNITEGDDVGNDEVGNVGKINKLLLSDGRNIVIGIDCEGLLSSYRNGKGNLKKISTFIGAKIAVQKVMIRRGALLLTHQSARILGGEVQSFLPPTNNNSNSGSSGDNNNNPLSKNSDNGISQIPLSRIEETTRTMPMSTSANSAAAMTTSIMTNTISLISPPAPIPPIVPSNLPSGMLLHSMNPPGVQSGITSSLQQTTSISTTLTAPKNNPPSSSYQSTSKSISYTTIEDLTNSVSPDLPTSTKSFEYLKSSLPTTHPQSTSSVLSSKTPYATSQRPPVIEISSSSSAGSSLLQSSVRKEINFSNNEANLSFSGNQLRENALVTSQFTPLARSNQSAEKPIPSKTSASKVNKTLKTSSFLFQDDDDDDEDQKRTVDTEDLEDFDFFQPKRSSKKVLTKRPKILLDDEEEEEENRKIEEIMSSPELPDCQTDIYELDANKLIDSYPKSPEKMHILNDEEDTRMEEVILPLSPKDNQLASDHPNFEILSSMKKRSLEIRNSLSVVKPMEGLENLPSFSQGNDHSFEFNDSYFYEERTMEDETQIINEDSIMTPEIQMESEIRISSRISSLQNNIKTDAALSPLSPSNQNWVSLNYIIRNLDDINLSQIMIVRGFMKSLTYFSMTYKPDLNSYEFLTIGELDDGYNLPTLILVSSELCQKYFKKQGVDLSKEGIIKKELAKKFRRFQGFFKCSKISKNMKEKLMNQQKLKNDNFPIPEIMLLEEFQEPINLLSALSKNMMSPLILSDL